MAAGIQNGGMNSKRYSNSSSNYFKFLMNFHLSGFPKCLVNVSLNRETENFQVSITRTIVELNRLKLG